MAISDQERLAMYDKLREVLGMDDATTMMGHLPPGGWEAVFLQQDARLVAEMDQRFAAVDTKFAEMDAKLERGLRELERSMREHQRTLFLGMLAAQTAFVGVVIGLLRAFG